jgi:hypothetical protein
LEISISGWASTIPCEQASAMEAKFDPRPEASTASETVTPILPIRSVGRLLPRRSQEPPPPGPGCGESLDYWFDLFRQPPEPEPEEPEEPDEIMMAELPQACRGVLAAGEAETIPAPQRRPQTPRPARASRPATELPWLRGAAAPPPDRKPKREDIQ